MNISAAGYSRFALGITEIAEKKNERSLSVGDRCTRPISEELTEANSEMSLERNKVRFSIFRIPRHSLHPVSEKVRNSEGYV